ncbi:hypothetical protein LZ554_000336 [Drepanopeziza brunnea f. sp. 'monogermtubi']|nr:hypothetical protein LZ554_000336 [Drepanopeziza brunnea f. sp. 'monogermtubi']
MPVFLFYSRGIFMVVQSENLQIYIPSISINQTPVAKIMNFIAQGMSPRLWLNYQQANMITIDLRVSWTTKKKTLKRRKSADTICSNTKDDPPVTDSQISDFWQRGFSHWRLGLGSMLSNFPGNENGEGRRTVDFHEGNTAARKAPYGEIDEQRLTDLIQALQKSEKMQRAATSALFEARQKSRKASIKRQEVWKGDAKFMGEIRRFSAPVLMAIKYEAFDQAAMNAKSLQASEKHPFQATGAELLDWLKIRPAIPVKHLEKAPMSFIKCPKIEIRW